MLSLRIPKDAMAAIDRLATERGVPVSALVRGWILQALAEEGSDSVPEAVERLAVEVDRLRTMVGR
jgi:hypothetical protein